MLSIILVKYTSIEKMKLIGKKVVYWFTKAAEQNHPNAQYAVGVCHAGEMGVAQSGYGASIGTYKQQSKTI